jgi:hypothetical protein
MFRKFLQLAGVEWIRAEMDWFYISVRGHAAFGSRLLNIFAPFASLREHHPFWKRASRKDAKGAKFFRRAFNSVCSRCGAQPFIDLLLCSA